MSTGPTLAPHDTLLGLLQRGRGSGLRTVLAGSVARTRDCLLACLREDPRVDSQVETRETYYADVATAAVVSVDEIRELLDTLALRGEDTRFYGQYLVAGVLGVLVARGDEEATRALADEVRCGPAWHVAAEELSHRVPRERWLPLGEVLLARLSETDVRNLAEGRYEHCDPWRSWAEGLGRFRRALDVAGTRMHAAPPVAPDPTMTTTRLLDIAEWPNADSVSRALATACSSGDVSLLHEAAREGTGARRAVALDALRELGAANALDEALEALRTAGSGGERRAALRYIASLPPERTLERARAWVSEPWPLCLASQEVLRLHASGVDLPVLLDALTTKGDEHHLPSFAVDALGRLGAAEARPVLRARYETTGCSYVRWRIARALARIERDFARDVGAECLFDCEPDTRLLGIEHADRTAAGVLGRIRSIAADPAEEEPVAARARAGGPRRGRVPG